MRYVITLYSFYITRRNYNDVITRCGSHPLTVRLHAEPLVYGQYSRLFRLARRVWYRD